ncbi:response regulator [Pseudomonas sp. DWP3-1-2]|uniref:response regulator n=1 Tax=Pseudomonas sp. DWP3-1-2 TaxID=2804645 RepID=UPI003CFAA4CD
MITPSILVLEDDDVLRMLLVEIIEDMGAIVIAYASADDGLIFLERSASQLSLIVSDINMPGVLDGHELSTLVTRRWPSLPMILTSGKVHRLPDIGPNIRFIPKPWVDDAMLNCVQSFLSHSRNDASH